MPPHPCPICNCSLTTSFKLTEHMRTHTGDKPFSCPTCHKAFPTQKNLSRHLKTHLLQNGQICTLCSKSLSDANSLRRHLIWHEKLAKCSVCGVGVGERAMRRHVQERHAEWVKGVENREEFGWCEKCGGFVRYQCDFAAHVRGCKGGEE